MGSQAPDLKLAIDGPEGLSQDRNGDAGYPAHVLTRAPAPPYQGEGLFALWHFSEDGSLKNLKPHVARTAAQDQPLVWAVDTRHAPLYWFPRQCPRGCVWLGPGTTELDQKAFFGQTSALRLHIVESAWVRAIRHCRLYAYRLDVPPFRPHDVGGYWVSDQEVQVGERVEVGDLFERHGDAGIELRVTPSIWPLWDAVARSSLEFSGVRLRNSAGFHQ